MVCPDSRDKDSINKAEVACDEFTILPDPLLRLDIFSESRFAINGSGTED
jgi:hypothetical protein